MMEKKWFFLIALIGHLLCGVCDCCLTYLPNGRFPFAYMKDNQKLSAVFEGMPLRNAVLSMVLDCLAMCMMFFGYLALARDRGWAALVLKGISPLKKIWALAAPLLMEGLGDIAHKAGGQKEQPPFSELLDESVFHLFL